MVPSISFQGLCLLTSISVVISANSSECFAAFLSAWFSGMSKAEEMVEGLIVQQSLLEVGKCLFTGMFYLSVSQPIVPSGKLSHNYGKSPFFMGKSTISMAIFNSYVTNYQAGYHVLLPRYDPFGGEHLNVPGWKIPSEIWKKDPCHLGRLTHHYPLVICYIAIENDHL